MSEKPRTNGIGDIDGLHGHDDLTIYPKKASALFTLGILVVAYVVSFIDRQILSLLVIPISEEMKVSDSMMGLLQGLAFALFYCALGIPLARLADRMNRKYIIAAGIFVWSCATVACGLAPSFAALFVSRMIVGVGEAVLGPAGTSLLSDSFRPERLVRALATFGMGALIGAGLAYLVGGTLIDAVGRWDSAPMGLAGLSPWRAAFVIVGLPGIVVALLILFIQEPARICAGGGQHLPFGQVLSFLWQRRPSFGPFYVCATLLTICTYGGLAWMPTHMSRTFGMSTGTIGIAFGSIQIIGTLIGTYAGAFLTERMIRLKYQNPHLRTVGLVASLLALLSLAPLMPHPNAVLGFWFLVVVLQGAHYGSITAALQLITPNRMRATNMAIFLLIVSMGGLGIGASVVGAVSDIFFAGNPRGIGISLTIVMVIASGMAAAIAWWSLGREPIVKEANAG